MATGSRSGSRFGPYELRRLLGAGAMGEVYEAFDTVKGRTVAIKLLPERFATDPEYRDRFVRESQIVARLNNPHVVPVHNFGQIDGTLFLEMVLVQGHDLGTLLGRNGPMPPQVAVDLLEQVADATDAAHHAGLVHRDIKPANVLVNSTGFAYLSDFGIASSKGPRDTTAGVVVGSVAYMAPERFTDGPTTPAVDIYSLGCVLFECLTGQVPFPRNDLQDVIHAHVAAPVPALPEPAAALTLVVQRAMAKNPADRYPSATAMMAEARDAVAPPAPKASKVWRVAAIAAIVVALVTASAGGWAWTHRGAPKVALFPAGTTTAEPFVKGADSGANDNPNSPHSRYTRPVTTASTSASSSAGGGGLNNPSVGGSTPGLYGSSTTTPCDAPRLQRLIDSDPHKKAVWAKLQGIPVSQVDEFMAALAPVVLRVDTYVTNSDYKDKKYEGVTYPAVLQAGTAVLVDDSGMPRVKCNCGNPLLAPPSDVSTRPTTGKGWPAYRHDQVRTIVKAAKPISTLHTVDVRNGSTTSTPISAPGADPKDSITKANFGQVAWTVPGAGLSGPVTLSGGRGTATDKYDKTRTYSFALSDNSTAGAAPIYADLNGDGYLDTIRSIAQSTPSVTGETVRTYVWVWSPTLHKPVQLQPEIYSGESSTCPSKARSITVDSKGVISVVGVRDVGSGCTPMNPLQYVVRGNTVVDPTSVSTATDGTWGHHDFYVTIRGTTAEVGQHGCMFPYNSCDLISTGTFQPDGKGGGKVVVTANHLVTTSGNVAVPDSVWALSPGQTQREWGKAGDYFVMTASQWGYMMNSWTFEQGQPANLDLSDSLALCGTWPSSRTDQSMYCGL